MIGAGLIVWVALEYALGWPSLAATSSLDLGSRFSLSSTNLVDSPKLVIAVSGKCRHSAQSASFHQRLIALAATAQIPVVLLLEKGTLVPEHLAQATDSISYSARVQLREHGIYATPTVFLTSQTSFITALWVGKLREVEEEAAVEVITGAGHRLTDSKDRTRTWVLSDIDLRRRLRQSILLDVRDRGRYSLGHLDGSLNIPLDELGIRAEIELSRRRPIVLDCGAVGTAKCELALKVLEGGEFENLGLLNLGRSAVSCLRSSTR
jgi:hypothetical protein